MIAVDDYVHDTSTNIFYKVTYVSEFFIETVGCFLKSKSLVKTTFMIDSNGFLFLSTINIIKPTDLAYPYVSYLFKIGLAKDPKEVSNLIESFCIGINKFCSETRITLNKEMLKQFKELDNNPTNNFMVH